MFTKLIFQCTSCDLDSFFFHPRYIYPILTPSDFDLHYGHWKRLSCLRELYWNNILAYCRVLFLLSFFIENTSSVKCNEITSPDADSYWPTWCVGYSMICDFYWKAIPGNKKQLTLNSLKQLCTVSKKNYAACIECMALLCKDLLCYNLVARKNTARVSCTTYCFETKCVVFFYIQVNTDSSPHIFRLKVVP